MTILANWKPTLVRWITLSAFCYSLLPLSGIARAQPVPPEEREPRDSKKEEAELARKENRRETPTQEETITHLTFFSS